MSTVTKTSVIRMALHEKQPPFSVKKITAEANELLKRQPPEVQERLKEINVKDTRMLLTRLGLEIESSRSRLVATAKATIPKPVLTDPIDLLVKAKSLLKFAGTKQKAVKAVEDVWRILNEDETTDANDEPSDDYVRLVTMRSKSGALLYDRLALAKKLLEDPVWCKSADGGGDGATAVERLEATCFSDVCVGCSLTELLVVMNDFPSD